MKLKIAVSQENIMKGQFGKVCYCPIALALRERGFKNVTVLDNSLSFDDGFRSRYGLLPRSAIRFINNFDLGKTVKPFKFFVEAC